LRRVWRDDGSGSDFIAHRAGTLPFVVVECFLVAARKTFPATNES